jgi:hypothetical protein
VPSACVRQIDGDGHPSRPQRTPKGVAKVAVAPQNVNEIRFREAVRKSHKRALLGSAGPMVLTASRLSSMSIESAVLESRP